MTGHVAGFRPRWVMMLRPVAMSYAAASAGGVGGFHRRDFCHARRDPARPGTPALSDGRARLNLTGRWTEGKDPARPPCRCPAFSVPRTCCDGGTTLMP